MAGFHTEYSSMKFGLFFLGEFANMIAISSIAVDAVPRRLERAVAARLAQVRLVPRQARSALLFFFIWVRWTFPRLRYDQLMNLGWKVLLPLVARERRWSPPSWSYWRDARHDRARSVRRRSPAALVVSRLLVVLHRNPVHERAVPGAAFCSLAGIYLLLHAEFLGIGAGHRLRRRDHGAVPVRRSCT